jgi:hypothetical protein
MFKQVMSFLIMFAIFFVGIVGFTALQKEKKIIVRNIAIIALGCSVLAFGALALIVYLF